MAQLNDIYVLLQEAKEKTEVATQLLNEAQGCLFSASAFALELMGGAVTPPPVFQYTQENLAIMSDEELLNIAYNKAVGVTLAPASVFETNAEYRFYLIQLIVSHT